MKTLDEYLKKPYRMNIKEDKDEGGYVVFFPELPGCITCGETIESAVKNAEDAKRTIIQVYLNYVSYCKELGVEFMAGYYDTKNQALNPVSRTERPYPIVTVQNYVEKAIKEGRIQMNVEIEAFTTDIRMIVIGNVFEWCLRNGEADFEGNMVRSLGKYLDSTLD